MLLGSGGEDVLEVINGVLLGETDTVLVVLFTCMSDWRKMKN